MLLLYFGLAERDGTLGEKDGSIVMGVVVVFGEVVYIVKMLLVNAVCSRHEA